MVLKVQFNISVAVKKTNTKSSSSQICHRLLHVQLNFDDITLKICGQSAEQKQ